MNVGTLRYNQDSTHTLATRICCGQKSSDTHLEKPHKHNCKSFWMKRHENTHTLVTVRFCTNLCVFGYVSWGFRCEQTPWNSLDIDKGMVSLQYELCNQEETLECHTWNDFCTRAVRAHSVVHARYKPTHTPQYYVWIVYQSYVAIFIEETKSVSIATYGKRSFIERWPSQNALTPHSKWSAHINWAYRFWSQWLEHAVQGLTAQHGIAT